MTKMITISGKVVDLFNPTPDMIDVEDIAFHLSHINRFNGAARDTNGNMVSVAYHCSTGAMVADYEGDRELALHMLLHDAHEAYIGDITTPAVNALSEYMIDGDDLFGSLAYIKIMLDRSIYKSLGLQLPDAAMKKRIKEMDIRLLRFERNNFFPKSDPAIWPDHVNQAKEIDFETFQEPNEPNIEDGFWFIMLKELTTASA